DLKPEATAHEVAVTLRRGVTLQGRVVGPDGQAVARALLLSPLHVSDPGGGFALHHDHAWEPVPVRDGRFTLRGCDPQGSVPAVCIAFEKQWGAAVNLSGRQAGKPVTVRLQPCGSAKARCATLDGKPVPKHRPDLQLALGDSLRGWSYYQGAGERF